MKDLLAKTFLAVALTFLTPETATAEEQPAALSPEALNCFAHAMTKALDDPKASIISSAFRYNSGEAVEHFLRSTSINNDVHWIAETGILIRTNGKTLLDSPHVSAIPAEHLKQKNDCGCNMPTVEEAYPALSKQAEERTKIFEEDTTQCLTLIK